MKNYYLFLDESKPNGSNIKYLCLGGIIIEEDIYKKNIIKDINSIKNSVFGNTEVILHESEIRAAKGEYVEVRKVEKRNLLWNELKRVFTSNNITTIGAAIEVDKYRSFYEENSLNDEYFIVLQIVLENFVHFLQKNDGIGSVYIESRDHKNDMAIRNIYHKIIANGTLYLNANTFQDRLFNINFVIKADNNIGAQLADFIPGTLNRLCNGLNPKKPSILTAIESDLYDGKCNLPERFGFKVMP
ncbi:DUF3800 domain-containing protein [Clostridium sp. ZBS12]|uniref:DUF3800 domain-containing protein n=1 Tax=Clostridium sp. ZBS12 TaxID=2949972 RepID=UPI0020797479|nr:DUF3800 domain-containing protein [Clostridium sp. ZBS12]